MSAIFYQFYTSLYYIIIFSLYIYQFTLKNHEKISLLGLLIVITSSCTSQKISTAVTEPTKYMNTITADELKLTCIL
jgi:hypothetical protein